MKKAIFVLLSVVLATGTAFAANTGIPNADASAAIKNIDFLSSTNTEMDTVLKTIIQVPQQKELVFDVALQCSLYTDTLVRSKLATRDTSTAMAEIDVCVMVNKVGAPEADAVMAFPGVVTYSKRTQTLSATFQGMIADCLSVDDAGDVVLDEECVTPEELQLILDTMDAHSFNFVAANLEQGEYEISVMAKIQNATNAEAGVALSHALIGWGSMLVNEVRFIKGADGTSM